MNAAKNEYVSACVRAVRAVWAESRRQGWNLDGQMAAESAVARKANEHYDAATLAGRPLRAPESYA